MADQVELWSDKFQVRLQKLFSSLTPLLFSTSMPSVALAYYAAYMHKREDLHMLHLLTYTLLYITSLTRANCTTSTSIL